MTALSLSNCKSLSYGVFVALITGMAAMFLSEHYGAPAMLFALLLGIALSFLYQDTQCKSGIDFSATTLLRIGVALLGLRLSFNDLISLGWQTAAILIGAMLSTILIGVWLARVMGLQKRFGTLTGGSVAICGASAAMAISAVLPDYKEKERDTLLTVIGVTSMSTIAMVLYPIITQSLGLSNAETGLFLGGTIHDVAQVVGAGYSVSDKAGDLSTLIKLVRVSLLMPIVLMILITIKHSYKGDLSEGKTPGVPAFLIAFVLLMVLNSAVALPSTLTALATNASSFALVTSIAAIGMKSNLGQLTKVGFKPVLLMLMETVWIALVIMLAIYICR